MLNQKLQQKLLQKLSPQQIQLMKLLQIPTMAMEQRIKQEIEENPALEEGTEEVAESSEAEIVDEDEFNEDDSGEETDNNDEFSLSDYIDGEENPSYAPGNVAENENKEIPFAAAVSLNDYLFSQLGMHILDEKEFAIASHIIGSIDESGYLQRDINAMVNDLAFSQNIITTPQEILQILKVIQQFDPPGIAARDLKECLLIQLNKKEQTAVVKKAAEVIDKCFESFTKKHYNKILSKVDISEQELKSVIDEVLKLNPKPGASEGSRISQYVIPDFIVAANNGNIELILNSKNAPELRLSKTYIEMLQDYSKSKDKGQKEAVMFIKQKIDSAKWFIDAIKQRQNTLYATMQSIIDFQKEYFITGDEMKLKPMILKDIAGRINMDVSTVSRVASSKYVQTPFGTFLLKNFFSESISTEAGEDVSTIEVKRILQDFIGSEDKKLPLNDDKLTELLKEKGYNIARRTIAKYREHLNIPVARLRKEL